MPSKKAHQLKPTDRFLLADSECEVVDLQIRVMYRKVGFGPELFSLPLVADDEVEVPNA